MQTISKYIVVERSSVRRLVQEVNKKIEEGWVPIGGFTLTSGRSLSAAQAMIYVKEKPAIDTVL